MTENPATAENTHSPTTRLTPLFVFGVARSGTTFSGYLLNRHPHIRCSHEAVIFQDGLRIYQHSRNLHDKPAFGSLLERLAECDAGSKTNRWIAETLRTYGDELYRRHQQQPGFPTLIEALFDLAQQNLHCFGNKFIRVEYCPLLLKQWPHARVVLLIRDPRAAFASQKRYFGMRLKYAAIYWNMHVRFALEHAEDRERYRVIRFEDLMHAPVEHLSEILSFAGQDPGLAEQIVSEVPPRVEALSKWREQLSSDEVQQLEEYCFEQMCTFGYQPELARGQRRITAAGRLIETLRQYAGKLPLDLGEWQRKRLWSRFWQMVRD
jgi:hypothetical protein